MKIDKEYNPNRKWTYDEKERMIELKLSIILEQGGICPSCKRTLAGSLVDLAHIIPKSKTNIRTLGWSILNHRFNFRATHKGSCNDGVLMDTGSNPEACKELINKIREDLSI